MGKMFLSTESISFQNKVFGKELENAFTAIQENCKTFEDLEKSEFSELISAITKKHTNLTISVHFTEYDTNAALTMIPSKNHIFLKKSLQEFGLRTTGTDSASKLVEMAAKYRQKNSVDLVNARVSGVFAEIESKIFLGVDTVLSDGYGLTPAEVTAVYLHEVAHQFTAYEYLSRQITTNQVIAGLAKDVEGSSPEKIRYDLKLASQLLGVDEKKIQSVENAESGAAVTTVVLDAIKNTEYDQIGSGFYNVTAVEQLADQFVARMGYGREFVTGCDKIDADALNTNNKSVVVATQILGAAAFVAGLFRTIGLMAHVGPVALIIYLAITLGLGSLDGALNSPLNKNYTYDDIRTRYARIREQQIQALKNSKLPKQETAELIESVNAIGELMKKRYEMESVYTVIFNKLFSGRREAINVLELNRELEELGNNDLFIKAAQLKQIA